MIVACVSTIVANAFEAVLDGRAGKPVAQLLANALEHQHV
jgi:hypothetical protein